MKWIINLRKLLSNLIYDQNYNCEKFNDFSKAFDHVERDSLIDSEFENPMCYYKNMNHIPTCTLLKFIPQQHSKEFLKHVRDCIYTFYDLRKCNNITICEDKIKNNNKDVCELSYDTEFIIKADGIEYLHIHIFKDGEININFCDLNSKSNEIRLNQIIKYISDTYNNKD